jgi:polyhydroxyalkanoate synthesis regulator phasin
LNRHGGKTRGFISFNHQGQMQPEQLRATVAELERQLSESASLDDQSRQALEQALRDIRSTLAEQTPLEQERHTLIGRLRFAVERFEGTHPTLTGTLTRLIDGLVEMGI